MPLLTADLLVDIVLTLATPQKPLVEASEIITYCNSQQIEYQGAGRTNQAFWDADLGEARGLHRLQKFKRAATAQGRNAWALSANLPAASAWASQHGWLLVPWSTSESNWKWELSGPGGTTPPVI